MKNEKDEIKLPEIVIKNIETKNSIYKLINASNNIIIIDEKKLGLFLKSIGVNEKEKCVLEKIKSVDSISYKCYLENKKEDIIISFKYSDVYVPYVDIVMTQFKNIKKEYTFFPGYQDKIFTLILNNFNFEDKIQYSIDNSNYIAVKKYSDKKIMVKINNKINNFIDVECMQNFLFNLELPIKVEDLYTEIDKLLLIDSNKINNINIEISHFDKKGEEIIECIEVENGNVKNLAVLRNGRFVIFNSNKNKGFETKKIEEAYIIKNNNGVYFEKRWPLGYEDMKIKKINLETAEIANTEKIVKTLLKK